jgi:hypothetical protein
MGSSIKHDRACAGHSSAMPPLLNTSGKAINSEPPLLPFIERKGGGTRIWFCVPKKSLMNWTQVHQQIRQMLRHAHVMKA